MNCKQCGKEMNPVDVVLSPEYNICGACCKINQERATTGKFTRKPSIKTLEKWMDQGGCESIDGCWIEPDGYCEHGKPSWMLVLGMI